MLQIPSEGLGLNPILQDPAHNSSTCLVFRLCWFSIIFSSALAATTLNYITKAWASHFKVWVLISWIFLTLGILLDQSGHITS